MAKPTLGDWEGGTIMGKGRQNAMHSLVGGKAFYMIIVLLEGKQAGGLAAAAIKAMSGLKTKTITFDNGLEFAVHEKNR